MKQSRSSHESHGALPGGASPVVSAWSVWFARLAVAAVFAINIHAAVSFIARPAGYTAAFEISGSGATTAVQAVGVLFLMWNATFPLVIAGPSRHLALFGVVLVQQAIAVAGDLVLRFGLSGGGERLAVSVGRFAVFDGAGLILMTIAFLWVWFAQYRRAV